MKVDVFKLPQNSPDDISALDAAIAAGNILPENIVAIMGKTEGNGCVNDFTRGFAVQSLQNYLSKIIGQKQAAAIVYVMSGGTEGVLSPHLIVFTSQDSESDAPKRMGLTLGVIHTRDFSPAEVGTLVMVEEVAAAVTKAMQQAGIAKDDVHFVQIKCPLITSRDRLLMAGRDIADISSYQSMGYSRGASALGVAVALGEVDIEDIHAGDICKNYDLYSSVASTSAGVELRNCEILVMGNSPQSTSDFVIGHSVMQHALDMQAIYQAIAATGQPISQVVNIFAKAEADPTGEILGRRHTMMDDSDINHTRMARAVVGAVVAAIVQDPMVYVSGGSEHQGPAGGGPVAAIAAIRSE
ncbi:ring-opening amidohydrolase [Pseudanabaena sp. FACHB-1277]|uniref:Cyanuric acid amidohydrolase n=1 Tax=Pseudanabaena cinerea FACHB-1277 TaxID=2949581 RepID=A0A926Z4T6_9CYAN|nr:ring-opening amidohydrolase [Pseudanabaena cinerea]MBD2148893.1 ring-opening amidohydrolase [Pseudanabaena cinerea FACHB-1277]